MAFSVLQRREQRMATAVKFKKLVEEQEESLGNENEREENESGSDEPNQEVVTLAEGTLTTEDVEKREKKCCKKCKSPFNSVAAVVIAISVFIVTLLISLIVVLIVGEPPPPFYTGKLPWRSAF